MQFLAVLWRPCGSLVRRLRWKYGYRLMSGSWSELAVIGILIFMDVAFGFCDLLIGCWLFAGVVFVI